MKVEDRFLNELNARRAAQKARVAAGPPGSPIPPPQIGLDPGNTNDVMVFGSRLAGGPNEAVNIAVRLGMGVAVAFARCDWEKLVTAMREHFAAQMRMQPPPEPPPSDEETEMTAEERLEALRKAANGEPPKPPICEKCGAVVFTVDHVCEPKAAQMVVGGRIQSAELSDAACEKCGAPLVAGHACPEVP